MRKFRLWTVLALATMVACGDDDRGGEAPIDSHSLSAPVEILVDSSGIPHLYARDDLDLFYAAGYQQAADRLFQLDMNRRAAVGRRAEVLGEAGVSGDVQAASLRFRRWGIASLELLRDDDVEAYNLIVAFTDGVNRRVDEVLAGIAPLPERFVELDFAPTRFEPWEFVSIGFRIQFGFSSTLDFDLLYSVLLALNRDGERLPVFQPASNSFGMIDQGIEPPRGAAVAARLAAAPAPTGAIADGDLDETFRALARFREDLGVGEGSNGWVVAGRHSADGHPILANDSHASLGDPNTLYLQHLSSAHADGSFDVIGFGFGGVPGVQLGHNDRLAWGATTNFADQTDLWSVELDGDAALLGGQAVAIERTVETFRVRLEGGGFETRSVEAIEVPGIGVILPDELLPVPRQLVADGRLLLGWRGFRPNDEIGAFLALARARSTGAARDAFDRLRFGLQNWLFATADDFGLHVSGEVPDRGPVAGRPRANRIMDGGDPANLWSGDLLGDEQLPRLDGDRDFISSANNDPWGFTADNDPLDDSFYYGSFFAPQFRAGILRRRLGDLIAAGAVDLQSMIELQTDVESDCAVRAVEMLEEAVEAIGEDPDLDRWIGDPALAAAAADLFAWDRRMTLDSSEAALYRIWFALLQRRILNDDLPLLFEAIDEAQPTTLVKIALLVLEQHIEPFLGGNRRVAILASLEGAIDEHERRGRPRWGDIHRSRLRDLGLRDTLVATPGDDATVNVSQCRFWQNGRLTEHCVATAGPVFRQVTTFEDDGTPVTHFNWPAGAGDTAAWVEGTYRAWLYREDEVRADSVSSVLTAGPTARRR